MSEAKHAPKAGDIWLYMDCYYELRGRRSERFWGARQGVIVGNVIQFTEECVISDGALADALRVYEHDGVIRIPKEKA